MVHTQTLDFMQWNQDSGEEQLMFFLERQRETIDDRSQDLKKLSDAIESLCFIDELEEHIVDGPSNVRAQIQEFSVYPMERGLKEIALTGILGVEKFKKLFHQPITLLQQITAVPEEQTDGLCVPWRCWY
jgi:hypothetical protein